MRYAAVMHQISYFGKIQLLIKQQFLHPFNSMGYGEFFDRGALYFRKRISEVGIIVIELFAEEFRQFKAHRLFGIMDELNNDIFDFWINTLFLSSSNSSPDLSKPACI